MCRMTHRSLKSHYRLKVLIVRFSSIGDIVLTSPIVRCVKQQLGAEIHFLTKTVFRNVVVHNPYIDQVFSIDKAIDEVVDQLKNQHYDLVIDLHKNIRSQSLRRTLGVKSISFHKSNIRKWLLVQTKKLRFGTSHIVDRYFDSLSKINIQNDGRGLDYFITPEDEEVGLRQVKDLRNYTVLVLGANYYTKQIPFEKCKEIVTSNQHHIILIGGEDVAETAKKLNALYPEKVIDLCGRIGINDSAGVIKHAHHVITGDTGMMHIAAAFQKDITVLWGSTIPEFGMNPYYGNTSKKAQELLVEDLSCRPCSKIGFNQCPKGHFRCMMDQNISTIKNQ